MNWIDIVIIVIIIGSLIRGFMTGLVLQIASLAGIILGAIFAGQLASHLYPHLEGLIGNSPHITGPASYIIGFLLILLAVTIIGRIINSVVKAVMLGLVNRTFGAIFCTLKWILVFSIVLNLVVELDQSQSIVKKEVRDTSHTFPIIIDIAKTAIPYLQFKKPNQPIDTTNILQVSL